MRLLKYLLVLLLFCTTASAQKFKYKTSFETGTILQNGLFNRFSLCNKPWDGQVVTTASATGSKAARFECRLTDTICGNSIRSEIYEYRTPGYDFWYAQSDSVPASMAYDTTDECHVQAHDDYTGATALGSPLWGYGVRNGRLYFGQAFDTAEINKQTNKRYDLGPVPTGWFRVIVHSKLRLDPSGQIDVWLGSVRTGVYKQVLSIRGSNFNKVNGQYQALTYMKMGLYKWPYKKFKTNPFYLPAIQTKVTYLDDMWLADSTATINDFIVPAPLTVDITGTNISCNNGSNGSITSSVTGGSGTKIYSWTGPGGFTSSSANISSRVGGDYSLTVTDTLLVAVTKNITLTQPTAVTATAVPGTIISPATTTNVVVSATGGVPPYINTGTKTGNIGSNTYTVTDANGCTGSATIILSQIPAPSFTTTLTVTNVYCFGNSNGAITSSVSGAAAPVTYAWTGPSGYTSTAQNISGRAIGNYQLITTDNASVKDTSFATIIQPPALVATATSGTISTAGGTTTVTVTSIGGTGSTTGTDTFTVSAGTYNYTVTDANNCTSVATITVAAYVDTRPRGKKIKIRFQ